MAGKNTHYLASSKVDYMPPNTVKFCKQSPPSPGQTDYFWDHTVIEKIVVRFQIVCFEFNESKINNEFFYY